MRLIRFRAALAATLAAPLLATPAGAATSCPRVLDEATRLVVVTVPTMDATRGSMSTFERAAPTGKWDRRSASEPAVVGARGVAWGHPFASLAKGGEPIKGEGDQRTPAGIYRLGASFGFDKTNRPGHLHLTPGANFCVNDPRSPLYGHIVPRSTVGKKVSGEDMQAFPLNKRGLVIDYPPNRAAKAGSCIFMHVWGGDGVGTAGCVALPEARMEQLRDWARARPHAAIAIVSEDTVSRFDGCLPAGGPSAHGDPAGPRDKPGDGERADVAR